jgi:hypothetical protein
MSGLALGRLRRISNSRLAWLHIAYLKKQTNKQKKTETITTKPLNPKCGKVIDFLASPLDHSRLSRKACELGLKHL